MQKNSNVSIFKSSFPFNYSIHKQKRQVLPNHDMKPKFLLNKIYI